VLERTGRWEADVGDGIPLGRIAGIRVAANWTLLIVVALLVLGLAGGVFPREYPGLAAGWYLVGAAVGAALFLVSLLATSSPTRWWPAAPAWPWRASPSGCSAAWPGWPATPTARSPPSGSPSSAP
jgi:hypothetical protein